MRDKSFAHQTYFQPTYVHIREIKNNFDTLVEDIEKLFYSLI